MHGQTKVLRLIAKLYEAYRSVTRTTVQVLNGQPAVMVERSKVNPGHASFFTMHFELNENSQMRRLHFVFAPSKLAAVRQKTTNSHDLDVMVP